MRESLEVLRDHMTVVCDAWGELEEAVDTWLDEDADRDERSDARETINQELGTLQSAVNDAVKVMR